MNFSKSIFSKVALVTVMGLLGTACAPSAPQLQKVMEEHPEILYAAMKKDPAKFIDVVNEVAEAAKGQKEQQQFEEGFKNPQIPEITDNRTIDGTKDAPVTVVEYSDFQCPYCQRGHATMGELLAAYPGKVRVIFKNYPIERIHPQAMKVSKLYEAIGTKDREKASKFKHEVFTNQEILNPSEADQKSSKSRDAAMTKYNARVDAELDKVIKGLGLNPSEIKKISETEEIAALIKKDQDEAQKFGFSGTPGYLVNGVAIRGAYPIDTFKQVVDRHLAAKK